MALIKCPDCGKEFSDQAVACPNCGRPSAINNTKFCKHCASQIDKECIICPKCGRQVEQLAGRSDPPVIINNSASSSSSSSASAATFFTDQKRILPWYLKWFWIFILGCFTGGIYWIIGFILRVLWKSKN